MDTCTFFKTKNVQNNLKYVYEYVLYLIKIFFVFNLFLILDATNKHIYR